MKYDKIIRVLQVGMSPYYGGTESFLMSQYRAIDKKKIQFDFLNVYNVKIACQDEIETLGGHIYYLDMARHHGLRSYYKNLDEFFAKNARQFDAVHCNFQSLINTDVLKYAKKYGIKVRIAHAHNSGYGTEPNLKQKLLIGVNQRTLGLYATHYFACSSLAAKWMFKNKETTIIHNAIETTKYLYNPEIRNKIRLQYGLADEKLLLFVGRLDPQKNLPFLIEIFSKVIKLQEKWKLFIIGDGILRSELEKLITCMHLQDKIQLLGTRNNVNEFLQAADAFLLPSKFEGLGIVLIEAQAAGIPCFTSKNVVPPEVDVTGLVRFISLDDSALVWAKDIVENTNDSRVNQAKAIEKSGYDSISSIRFIENEYLRMVLAFEGI